MSTADAGLALAGSSAILLLALLVPTGCPAGDADDDATSADDDETGDDDTATDDDTTPLDDDDSAGDPHPCLFPDPLATEILVSEGFVPGTPHGYWSPSVRGLVGDHPAPVHLQVIAEDGECRYLRWHHGQCEPPCDLDEACDVDDVCVPQRAGVSGGTLSITGAGILLEIEPTEGVPGHYWATEDLPDDLFGPGDPIRAELSGDTLPAIALEARGVAPMDVDLAEQGLTLDYGQDAGISWTAGPDPDVCVELYLVQQGPFMHGDIPEEILWCAGHDDGSLTIPLALVDLFPIGDPGPCDEDEDWFCASSHISRYTRDTVTTSLGPAELRVESEVPFLHRQSDRFQGTPEARTDRQPGLSVEGQPLEKTE